MTQQTRSIKSAITPSFLGDLLTTTKLISPLQKNSLSIKYCVSEQFCIPKSQIQLFSTELGVRMIIYGKLETN